MCPDFSVELSGHNRMLIVKTLPAGAGCSGGIVALVSQIAVSVVQVLNIVVLVIRNPVQPPKCCVISIACVNAVFICFGCNEPCRIVRDAACARIRRMVCVRQSSSGVIGIIGCMVVYIGYPPGITSAIIV